MDKRENKSTAEQRSEESGSGADEACWPLLCSLSLSGGKSCKREDWTKQADAPAIQGLHSTWVSANVLAMQRPSSRLIKQYGIIDQFKKANVGAIINLQLAGEHPHCGDGIHAAGFSYRPEEFTDAGIFYYNPGWVDMNTPSLEKMVEIVQIMSFHTQRVQKVSVHWSATNTHACTRVRSYLQTLTKYPCALCCRAAQPCGVWSHWNRHRMLLRLGVRLERRGGDQVRA